MKNLLKAALLGLTVSQSPTAVLAADLMTFWDVPQRGANSFNRAVPDQAYFDALAATGASWVRLAFAKWESPASDFLIGDADAYAGLVADDLAVLTTVLDRAHAAGLKVVVVPLSLPGSRWSQQNDGMFDDRLWSDSAYWDQAARFWVDLASALKHHPAVAAYNLVNEPAPERTQALAENGPLETARAFVASHAGTARDLPGFYDHVIAAIREVDPATPIMVDAGYFANPRSLAAWPGPLQDSKVVYAVHMYEPYEATSAPNRHREEPLRYPGVETAYDGASLTWDRQAVHAHLAVAFDWARSHGLPATRVAVAEFGCVRTWEDCGTYLSDVLDGLEMQGGHWAFYAFRPDEWDAMDYEIPRAFPPGRFYWFMEENRAQDIPRDGALFALIANRLAVGN